MDRQLPTDSFSAEIKYNPHKKTKGKLLKSTKSKKRTILKKMSTVNSTCPSESSKTVILHEYQLKSQLTWEYTDFIQDMNNWNKSLKAEDAESQPIKLEPQLTKEENLDDSAVFCINSGSVMNNLSAPMDDPSGHSRQNLYPEYPHESSEEINTGPLDSIIEREIPEESSKIFTTMTDKTIEMMSEIAPRPPRRSLRIERLHHGMANISNSSEQSDCKDRVLTTHQEGISAGENPHTNTHCSEDFDNQSSFNNHQCIDVKCKQCPQLSSTSDESTVHQGINSSEKPFKSTECPMIFSNRSALTTHQRFHTGKKPHKCTECPKMFLQTSHLKRHLLVHSGDKPFKCTKCPKMFSQMSHLNLHQRIHSGHKPYKCTVCSQMFSQSGNLTTHQLLHSGEKPFKCTECPKMFSQRGHLTAHQRIHSGVKPFKCTECPKTFSERGNLTKHKRIHSGEKPYKCTKCSQMFSESGNLTKHKRIHSGEKPYKCTKCSQMSSEIGNLTKHKRIHSGEKPFKCTECPKMFSQKSHLNRHQCVH